MRLAIATFAIVLAVAACETALAQSKPAIPNSALAGREREQFLGKPGPQPGVPQIELWGGRPQPVIEQPQNKRPAKRRKNSAPRR